MAKFVVKGKDKIGSGKIAFDADVQAIDFGTHSNSAILIEDPVVADHHCEIQFVDGAFRVRDMGSALGTFLNGASVDEPTALASGDEIVIGLTRLVATVDGEKLTLDVTVGGFAYEKGDLDRFVEQEVAFGRYAPVRIGNWLAVFAIILLVPAMFFDAVEEPLLDPGPLNQHHAMLFTTDPATLEEPLAGYARLAQANGCTTCHDTMNRTPMDRCAQCHADLMGGQHPFRVEASDDPGRSTRGYFEHDCLLCHVDHRGPVSVDGSFIPTGDQTRETCDTCHESLPSTTREPAAVALNRAFPVAYNTFPHDKHLAAGVEMACTECHALPENPVAAQPVAGHDFREDEDFEPVPYETCMRCHETGTTESEDAPKYKPEWHGTDDPANCLQCHQKLNDEELKQVQTSPVAMLGFQVKRRDHHPEFQLDVKLDGRDCVDCHRDGAPTTAGADVVAPFWHGVHMASLTPGDDGACIDCHVEVSDGGALAAGLAEGHYAGAQGNCAECHDTGAPVADAGSLPAPVSRNDFPHGLHLDRNADETLKDGCFACHDFSEPSDQFFAAVPTTKPGAKDCTMCHVVNEPPAPAVAHARVQEGSCLFCHRAGDPVYRNEPRTRQWPELNLFDHYSRGHLKATVEGDCGACHTGTETATDVMTVPIPDESQQNCRDCHVDEKARFHWR